MTIHRSLLVFAFPLAIALAASTAHARPVKQDTTTAKPATPAKTGIAVQVSPNVATSVKDWHPELNGKTAATAHTTAAALNRQPPHRGNRSEKPAERAQEVPLSSVKR